MEMNNNEMDSGSWVPVEMVHKVCYLVTRDMLDADDSAVMAKSAVHEKGFVRTWLH